MNGCSAGYRSSVITLVVRLHRLCIASVLASTVLPRLLTAHFS